jgi:hypothetical protein
MDLRLSPAPPGAHYDMLFKALFNTLGVRSERRGRLALLASRAQLNLRGLTNWTAIDFEAKHFQLHAEGGHTGQRSLGKRCRVALTTRQSKTWTGQHPKQLQ